MKNGDRYIRYYALDVILLGSEVRLQEFRYIALGMADEDEVVVEHALLFMCAASDAQRRSALKYFKGVDVSSPHVTGLQDLTSVIPPKAMYIRERFAASRAVERLYGLALAERFRNVYPELLQIAGSSDDDVIRTAAQDLIRVND